MNPQKQKKTYPLWALLALFLVAMLLQLTRQLPLAALGVALFLGYLRFTDKAALRAVGNPRFWLMGLALAALSGLLLGKHHEDFHGIPISIAGLESGVFIIFRMFIFVSFIMSVSKRMSADGFVRAFGHIGFPQVGTSFALGIELLPKMLDGWKESFKKGQTMKLSDRVIRMLAYATDLADAIIEESESWMKPRKEASIFTVTGGKGSGKTSFLEALDQHLKSEGVQTAGFIQKAIHEKGERIGYDLHFLDNGESVPLARKSENATQGKWRFRPEAFALASAALFRADTRAVCFVDELGLLELGGEGHWPALAKRAPERGGIFVFSVRHGLADTFLHRLGYLNIRHLDLPATKEAENEFKNRILKKRLET